MSRYRSSYPLTSMAGGHGTDRLPSRTIPKVDKWRVEERCLSWGQRCGHVGRSMVHAFSPNKGVTSINGRASSFTLTFSVYEIPLL